MIDYEHKYIKYKTKYMNIKTNQSGGKNKIDKMYKYILLDGTSSSGKTTISKFYEKYGYYCIASDDYSKVSLNELLSVLPNEYLSNTKSSELLGLTRAKNMYSASKKYDKVVFDDISQNILKVIPRKQIFVIIVYCSLDTLTRNMTIRRFTDYRGKFVFDQYANRYVKTNTKKDSLDVINRKNFVTSLETMKADFESEDKLMQFATNVFNKMNIDDDNDHYIKLRDEYTYDYIIDTKNKTPSEIFDELKNVTIL